MDDTIQVLVVDDDPAVQASLTAYLEDEGFVVRSTSSAGDALTIVAASPIDFAIVDIRLGEIGGEEFILRAAAIQAQTRFLVYTGSLGYRLPESLVRIGMDQSQVFYKPLRTLKVVADEIRRVSNRGSKNGEREKRERKNVEQ